MGISTFQHILQDTNAEHSLLLASPGFDQPKFIHGKEIGVLQALTSTPPANKSKEDLQSLVHEITSVVEEAKAMKIKSGPPKNWKRVGKITKLTDSDAESTDSFQNRRQDGPEQSPEPERPAERESPSNLKRSLP